MIFRVHRKSKRLLLLGGFLLGGAGVSPVFAEGAADPGDFNQNSVEAMMGYLSELKVEVASKKPLTLRDSPAIVTVITAEEIQDSGARDLMDVLRLVPGVDFGTDTGGVVGISIRGNWAHEGKALLLWDGVQINDNAYTNLAFGNRFPVDQIKQVEIIRGPGSAIYGGYAELAVINVITKGADDLDGIAVSGSYSRMGGTYGQRDLSFGYGKRWGDFRLSASVFLGQGHRSNRDYTDAQGSTFNLADNSELNPAMVNLAVGYKGLDVRLLMEQYRTLDRTIFGASSPPIPTSLNFTSYNLDVKYKQEVIPGLAITPFVQVSRQKPWNTIDPILSGISGALYDKTIDRYKGGLFVSYDVTDQLNLLGGIEAFEDAAMDRMPGSAFKNGSTELRLMSEAVYAQALYTNPIVNVTLGGRFDNNNRFGSELNPRLALTKVIERFNFKGLFNRAFRAPGIENINSNGKIQAETTTDYEFEAGYQVTDKQYASVNVFATDISQPIVYNYVGGDSYYNYEKMGTKGLELQYRVKDNWGYSSLSYSYAGALNSVVPAYSVPGDSSVYLGMSKHKITWQGHLKIWTQDLSFDPTWVYLSSRNGYDWDSSTSALVLRTFDPVYLVNLFFNYRNIGVKGLTLGLGCFNLLNQDEKYVQPYTGGHPPLPGEPREFVARLSYQAPI